MTTLEKKKKLPYNTALISRHNSISVMWKCEKQNQNYAIEWMKFLSPQHRTHDLQPLSRIHSNYNSLESPPLIHLLPSRFSLLFLLTCYAHSCPYSFATLSMLSLLCSKTLAILLPRGLSHILFLLPNVDFFFFFCQITMWLTLSPSSSLSQPLFCTC